MSRLGKVSHDTINALILFNKFPPDLSTAPNNLEIFFFLAVTTACNASTVCFSVLDKFTDSQHYDNFVGDQDVIGKNFQQSLNTVKVLNSK